jgi:hypothetical protein
MNYIEGDAGNDVIVGGNADDTLSGGDGDDTIAAGGGADTVYTGAGHDRVEGGGQESSRTMKPGRDTVYSQPGDRISGFEKVVTVQIRPVGQHIEVIGSPEFRERVEADLAMLRGSPHGQGILEALDRAHHASRASIADWPVVGKYAHQGDTYSITETHKDNCFTYPNAQTFAGDTWSRHPRIEYNPRLTLWEGVPPEGGPRVPILDGAPVSYLVHEFGHSYDYSMGLSGRADGSIVVPQGQPHADERAVIGVPIDDDSDPRTPPRIDPRHPYELTENSLNDEMGRFKRYLPK